MELPKRKPTRLKEYDYSTPGAYFITICTKNRRQLLSEIIVGDGVLDVPQNRLTQYGKISEKYITQLNNHYTHTNVDKYVIMPNHIHFIISVQENNGTPRTSSPTNSNISRFVSAFKRFCNKEYGTNVWQRSYHDHIIRDKNDYEKIWNYIDTNVQKWEEDCFYNN